MLSKLFAATTLLTAVSAMAVTRADQPRFNILSLSSANEIHDAYTKAAFGGLYLLGDEQKADCTGSGGDNLDRAVFYLDGNQLYLWTPKDKPYQRVLVSRSDLHPGQISYQTGAEDLSGGGDKREADGWTIEGNGDLTFRGRGILACPGGGFGAWYLWVDFNNGQSPPNNKGCVSISARTADDNNAAVCEYTVPLRH